MEGPLVTVARFALFIGLVTLVMIIVFINQNKFTLTCLITYLPIYLITYLLNSYVRRCCETLSVNFSKTKKLLKFCQGTFIVMIFVKTDKDRLKKNKPHFLIGVNMVL